MRFVCSMLDACNRMSKTFVRFRRSLKFIWTVSISMTTTRVKFENKTEKLNYTNKSKKKKKQQIRVLLKFTIIYFQTNYQCFFTRKKLKQLNKKISLNVKKMFQLNHLIFFSSKKKSKIIIDKL